MSFRDIKDGWHNYLVNNLIKSRKPNKAIQYVIDNRLTYADLARILLKQAHLALTYIFNLAKNAIVLFLH